MTVGAFFAFLAVLAVSFEMTVTAAVFGALAFYVIGHGGRHHPLAKDRGALRK
ncbi:hypothetical protein [Bradyrhizobium sp. AZCC 2289]|uniref:hypothetical protein n=1 Tax=Bradyrhizobium sp. AZCC 2289 TaxID=3117026 RepID=UPI002FF1F20F